MPALVTPQQCSQSASDSSCLRVVPKVRVSCWRRPGAGVAGHPDGDPGLGLGDVQAGHPLGEQRLVLRVLHRCLLRWEGSCGRGRSQEPGGKREIWSAGSRHHLAALKIGSRRQTVRRGHARQAETTSANDRGHSLSGHPRPGANIRGQRPGTHQRGSARRSRAPGERASAVQIFTPKRRHPGACATVRRGRRRSWCAR